MDEAVQPAPAGKPGTGTVPAGRPKEGSCPSLLSACPSEHYPDYQRVNRSIDSNWPDPPPMPDPIRFGP